MKKALTLLLIVGLITTSLMAPAAFAKKKKKKPPPEPVRIERVVEFKYDHPGIGAAPVGGYPATFPDSMEIPLGENDLYMKVEVIDASGQKVWGFISQGDLDGNGVNDDGYADFCGAHETAVPVAAPGQPIIGIYAYSGACDDGTPSVMTSGTIKFTLSNMP